MEHKNEIPLILEDVSFAYQDTPVLDSVSFQVKKEEFVGLIGPNGGGKTTLLKLILGFLKPSKGKVFVFGKPPQQARQQLAYVPQTLRFDRQFPISVLELVLAGRLAHLPWYGVYKERDYKIAREALDKVGLADFQDRSFGTLSGGQAQRVLIARALASEPQLLLLDEPTASVDAQSEADIYAILKSLSNHMTLLMVTHDLRAVIHNVQRVLCVQRQVMALKPEEVCEHFAFGLYHPPLVQVKAT